MVKVLDSLGSGFSGLKREMREKGRSKSRSLPTVSPLVLPGGGLLNQNWQPLRGRQLAKSPEKDKRSLNPFIQTEAVVHGVGGGAEALLPGGAEALLPDGGDALLPAGADALLPAGADALLPAGAGNLYENVMESPRSRPFDRFIRFPILWMKMTILCLFGTLVTT